MNGYHPAILNTPRNKEFLEENGGSPSAEVLSLLSVQPHPPNKENSIVKLFQSMPSEVSHMKWEGWETIFADSSNVN